MSCIAARLDAIIRGCDRLCQRLDALCRFARSDADWDESKHPRDEEGKFTEIAGGGSSAVALAKKLVPHKERAWRGKPKSSSTSITKAEIGQIGEDIALAYMRHIGLRDAAPLHVKSSVNFPLDLIGDHEIFEVKTGIASSNTTRWRVTIGQPGKAETEWLKTASAAEKAEWNKRKVEMAIARKQEIIEEFSRKLGHKLTGKTIGIIIDPDTGVADVHIIDGFHANIGWNSGLAKESYVGSFKYI